MLSLEKITTNMSDIICLINLELEVEYISPSVKKFLGFSPDDIIGKKIYDYIYPDDINKVRSLEMAIFYKRLIDARHDFRIRNKYGAYIWVEGIGEFIYDNNNDIEGLVVNIRRIIKRKYLEEKLRDSNKRLEKLAEELHISNKELEESHQLFRLNFERANIGMVMVNYRNLHVKVNDVIIEMLGYSKEEFEDMNFYEITHPDDIIKSQRLLREIMDGEKDSASSEVRYFNKNGDIIWVNWNTSIVRKESGEPLYQLFYLKDITEIKKQEEIINKQQEEINYNILKTQFFANLSHELRTPLNLIFSALQILTHSLDKEIEEEKSQLKKKQHLIVNNFLEADLNDRANTDLNERGNTEINKIIIDKYNKNKKYLTIIRQNSMRLLRLVNNVIDLTKIGVDNFELNFNNYNIVNIVRKIVESTESYIVEKGRCFVFNSSIKEKIIKCDPFSIERIVLNLISNAIKFSNKGDSIFVNIEDRDSSVIISVKDTGIGIKEDKKDIVFDLFRQVDESFTRRAEGSGIGLSIVKSLVELHGGTIYLESIYGEGTEFFVILPVDNSTENTQKTSYKPDNLIDKIDVEFSDIYNI